MINYDKIQHLFLIVIYIILFMNTLKKVNVRHFKSKIIMGTILFG